MAGESTRIELLLVEDNAGDAALVAHYARDVNITDGVVFRITHVHLVCHALDHIQRRPPDIILLDLGLPDATGLESLDAITAMAPAVPIVVITGLDDHDLALDALRSGAQDYLPKAQLEKDVLLRAVRYAIQRKEVEESLRSQVCLDKMTGLASRAYFDERFFEIISHANRLDDLCAVCVIDLDGFKAVNDNMGHYVGDQLLAEVGARLKECTRETDLVARLGGDEFAVVATHLKNKTDAHVIANNIAKALSKRYSIEGLRSQVKASIGLSLYPLNDIYSHKLLHQADIAMYHAKRSGGDGVAFYNSSMEEIVEPSKPMLDPVY